MLSACIGLTELITLQMHEYMAIRSVTQFISIS